MQGLHHLFTRKRIYKNLEKYPHPVEWKRRFDEFMYVVGIVGPFLIVPQILQVWVYRNVGGVSFTTWGLLGVGSLLWLSYGIVHKEKPIIITNILLCIFNFLVAAGVFLQR